jgi:hypothetical protein
MSRGYFIKCRVCGLSSSRNNGALGFWVCDCRSRNFEITGRFNKHNRKGKK